VNNCNLLKSLDIGLPRALFDVSSKSIRKAVPKGIHLRIYPSDIVQRLPSETDDETDWLP
jgi:hypothetical protein